MRKYKEYIYLAFEVYNNARICVKCYTTEKICVHHIDENPENNNEDNLQILCRSCHTTLHNMWNTYCLWYKHTDEARRNMSEASKWKTSPQKWKKLSEETKEKIRQKALWRIVSKETRVKLSKLLKWKPSPMKWKKHSKEARERISQSLLWNSYAKWIPARNKNKWKTIYWLWYTEWRRKTWWTRTEFYKLAK